jgi:hypothetical protein
MAAKRETKIRKEIEKQKKVFSAPLCLGGEALITPWPVPPQPRR